MNFLRKVRLNDRINTIKRRKRFIKSFIYQRRFSNKKLCCENSSTYLSTLIYYQLFCGNCLFFLNYVLKRNVKSGTSDNIVNPL